MGEVYSHLSEEERQVIQIEIGNGTGIRAIGAMIGRSPSTVSREIKRNTWFPSNESESYRPYRPRRLKTGPWTSRYYIAGPAGARPPGGAPKRASRIACRLTGCGRGWRRSWAAAGRRRPSAAGCASCSPATMPCACARRPSTDGSIPASVYVQWF
nr:helix-turn-helix domain-containing protein [Bifidobacterium bifidum]